tara:strand:+ start:3939 stop:5042 length:1104 start_codon:yes stop_codon:yes gene_type:complete
MNATGIILSSLLSAVFVSVLVLFHETSYIFEKALVAESVQAAKHSFNRSLIEKGILPEGRTEHLFRATNMAQGVISQETTNLKPRGALSVETVSATLNQSKILALGLAVRSETTDLQRYTQSSLSTPNIRLSGEIAESWFDLKNLVLPAEENPSGSYYRYTTDDSDPDENSPIWENEAFTPENMPKYFSVKSFHADGIYDPSDSIRVTFEMPSPEILLLREDGPPTHGVSYWEIKKDTNRLILTTKGNRSLYDIRYSLDQGNTWILFNEAFHVGFDQWADGTAEIRIKTTPKSPHFDEVFYSSIFLHPIKSKLLAPVFRPESGADLYPGLDVEITNINRDGNEIYGVISYTETEERFATQIPIRTTP